MVHRSAQGVLLRRLPPWGVALLCYVILSVGLTWPMAAQWTTHLPGSVKKDGLEDAFQNVWNLWWTWEALARPTNPLVSDRFFYPEQPNLFYHTLSPANTLLAAPITALWGPIAAFNAVALFSFVMGGMGAWALARARSGSQPGALLAGCVYAFSPYHYAVLVSDGQLQMFALQWLPWYVLFLLRAVEGGRRRDLLLAGLFLTLTAWTDWYYTLFLLLFTAGYGLWALVGGRGARDDAWKALLARLLSIGALFLVGAAPLLLPMLIEAARYDYMRIYPPGDPERLSADLLAFVLPARLHTLWGAAPWDWGVPYNVNRRIYLGAVALFLALLGAWRARAARRWGLGALAFGILALGPNLRVAGSFTGIPMPYALIADLPFINLARQPDRFDVMVTLCLAVMVAFGMQTIDEKLARAAPWPIVYRLSSIVLVFAALIIDYLAVPVETRVPPVPPFLANLPPGDGALLEYPFHDDVPYRDAERMLFQTVHGRPISGGYHSRLYPQPQLGLPVLRDLRAGQLASDIVAEGGGWRAALQTLDFDYIIGYKQQPLGPQNLKPEDMPAFRALVEQGLGVAAPDYEDQWLIAYRVPEAAPAPVVQIRAGWGAVEEGPARMRYRWLATEASLRLFAPTAGIYQFSFSALPAGGPRSLAVSLPDRRFTVPIYSGERRYTLRLALPAGRTLLTLRALEPPTSGAALEGNGDQRPISVRFAALALEQAANRPQ